MKTNHNTNKVIKRLAKNSIKSSRTRNIFIIITIILASGLITGMALSALAIDKKKQRIVEHMQQVIFHDVNEKQIRSLKNDKRIEETRLVKDGQIMEMDDYQVQLSYRDTSSKQIDLIGVKEGKTPKKMHEVAVKKQFLQEIGKEPKLGTTFSLTFLDGTTEEFTVCGFLDDERETKFYDILCSKEYADNGRQLKDIPYSVLARIENAEHMYQIQFLELLKEIGKDCDIDARYVNDNGNFVDSLKGGEASSGEKKAVIIVGLGILFVSILVIYSIFYLSVVGRIRQFGQLRTIGMNKKQIKKMLFKEGTMLGIRGIPLGIVIGSVVAYFMVPEGFSWRNTLITALCVFAACMAAILISIQKPAKIASCVSPMEALKYVGEASKGNKNTTKKLKRNMTPFGLAKIASDNHRKKTILTMITLGIGGVLIMVAGTLVMSIDEEKMARGSAFKDGEFRVEFSSNAIEENEHGISGLQADNPLTGELITQIKSIDGVKNVIVEKGIRNIWEVNGESGEHDVAILKKNEKEVQDFIVDGTGAYETLLENNQILAQEGAAEFFGEDFKVGDTVKMTFFDGTKEVIKEYTIGGILSEEYYYDNPIEGWFAIPEELIQEAVGDMNLNKTLIISSEKEKRGQVEKELKALLDGKETLKLATLREEVKNQHLENQSVIQMVVGISAFMIVFSLINLVNTIITNIASRRQEFSVLQSIGMSKKQLFDMLCGESLLLVAGNLIITLILGVLVGNGLILLAESMNITYLDYVFPTWFFIAYVIIVLIVPVFVTKIVLGQFEKEPLVQRMRSVD